MPQLTRNRIFEFLGATPKNPRWSWCALSSDGKRAVFTIWDDLFKRSCQLTPSDEAIQKRNGAKEQLWLAKKAIDEHIPAYGILCTAWDPTAEPRSIKRVNVEYLVMLQLRRRGDTIFAHKTGTIPTLELACKSGDFTHDGLRDIDSPPEGHATPDRAHVSGLKVIRDTKVRKFVIKKARGRCEHCGKLGFLMRNGQHYVEAHHIIFLAKDGPDTIDNVIALCPEHHRQAHFGKDAVALEKQFLRHIARRRW